LADKLLIVAALIALIPTRGVSTSTVIIIVGREIAVTGLRGIAVSQGMVIAASALGKYKTVLEVVAIFLLILGGNYLSLNIHQIGMGVLLAAMVLAVYSGVSYFKDFLKAIVI
jgi:CDP-diacylglycerol--glycerol-3-phosphate 3-phosphatidyltransferase